MTRVVPPGAHPLPPGVRRAGTVFAWTLGVVLAVALGAAAWIGIRGLAAVDHLRAAQQTADDAVGQLSDPAAASALIADLSADTSAARALTSDPVWWAASGLPWIGPQLSAVATVAAAVDDVASQALSPLADVAAGFSVDDLRPQDGAIDLAPFAAIAPSARTGADEIARAAGAVARIDRTALLAPVGDAVAQVDELLTTTAQTTDALARAATLLPAMLGADGPRDYLIVFQNNAEWRSLGGIIGAMALVHTEDGRMTLTAQASSSDFDPVPPEPVVPLEPELVAIFGTQPGRWVQNLTLVPDFSFGGSVARELWQREFGTAVDGVIAIDPVALSYLLRATGPVALPSGEQLTADNAVPLLLRDVYVRYPDPEQQDAFFAAAAAAVFGQLAGGDADPAALVQALGRAGDERRLLLWSAVEADQAVLEGTTLAGGMPVTDASRLGFGVFLNSATASKLHYWFDREVTLTWDRCTVASAVASAAASAAESTAASTVASAVASGNTVTGELTLEVMIMSDAPADAGTTLPPYVLGDPRSTRLPPGSARTVGYLALPEGTELVVAEVTGGGGFGGGFFEGRRILSFDVPLAPGESATATVTVRTTTPGAAAASAWVTPTIDPDTATRVTASCGG